MEEMAKVNPKIPAASVPDNVAGSILYDSATVWSSSAISRAIPLPRQLPVVITATEPRPAMTCRTSRPKLRDGDDWVIDGLKSFITLGGDCDVLVTLAQTDSWMRPWYGMQFFAIDRRSPGMTGNPLETYVNWPALLTYRVQSLMFVSSTPGVWMPASRRSWQASTASALHGGAPLARPYT